MEVWNMEEEKKEKLKDFFGRPVWDGGDLRG